MVWFLVPFVLFSLGLVTSVRYALVFMPTAILIAARGLWALFEPLTKATVKKRTLRGALIGVILFLVTGSGWYASREIQAMRCSYTAPVEFLKRHGTKHISLQYPVTRAYVGVENVKEPPLTVEMLKEYYQEGFRYYLIDYRKMFMQPPLTVAETGKIIEDIESTIQPAFSYVHPCYTLPCYIFEINISFRLTLKMVRKAHQLGVDQIRLYDLSEYFAQKGYLENSDSMPAGE
jgi:hypothetical protein